MENVAKKGKLTLNRKAKKRLFIIAMLTIPVIHFAVFWVWVNVDSILLVFQNNVGGWIGLENLRWVFTSFTDNPYLDMTEATVNTLIFFAWNMFVELPIAVVLAYVFYKNIPGNKFFTVCLYIPCIITPTVMTTVYKNFIGSDGPIALMYAEIGRAHV